MLVITVGFPSGNSVDELPNCLLRDNYLHRIKSMSESCVHVLGLSACTNLPSGLILLLSVYNVDRLSGSNLAAYKVYF